MLNRRQTTLIGAALTTVYLAVGLWPFNFVPRNNLEWLPGGIHFKPQSIAYSEGVLQADSASAAAMTIELWLEPDSEPAGNVLPLMSLYNGDLPENLLVAQWKSGLLVRAPARNWARSSKYQEVGTRGVLRKGVPRFLAITSGPAGTCFYQDEAAGQSYPNVILDPKALRGRLILGNASTGGPGWQGKLYGLGLFGKQLDALDIARHCRLWKNQRARGLASESGLVALYLFDEGKGRVIVDHSSSHCALVIPPVYHVLRRKVLVRPWNESVLGVSHIEDLAINILGFVPLGFFCFYCLRRQKPGRTFRNVALTVLAGGAVSLVIELSQVFLPTRSSSLTDLICNGAGALLGVPCVFLADRLFRRPAAALQNSSSCADTPRA